MATKAEKLCKNVSPDMKAQAVTLAKAVIAMQKKINDKIPEYAEMPLAQQVTVGTGEQILRANPAAQEFRAMVRDYSQALNSLQSILEKSGAGNAEVRSLDSIRAKFKVAK